MTTTAPDTGFDAGIAAWLNETAPARLLVLGTGTVPAPAGTVVETCSDPATLAPDAHYDAVLIRGALDGLDRRAGAALLARARDRLAHDCLAVLPRAVWDDGAVLGLGYTLRAYAAHALLAQYALATYKTVPDWLNSKFWAHPERWQP